MSEVTGDTAEPVRAALLAFVRAYANVDDLDRDQTEIKLFEAWLRACAALEIQPTASVRPRTP